MDLISASVCKIVEYHKLLNILLQLIDGVLDLLISAGREDIRGAFQLIRYVVTIDGFG